MMGVVNNLSCKECLENENCNECKNLINPEVVDCEILEDETTLGDLSGEPFTIQCLTNLNCNLACTYCYEHKCNKVNNEKDICDFIDGMIKSHVRMGRSVAGRDLIVDFIGGESLLYPKMLDNISTYALNKANEYGFRSFTISISSNGTRFEDPDVRWFVEKWAHRLNIGISVDGTKEVHDACRLTRDGKGSYDTIVTCLPWIWSKISNKSTKATFCHATMEKYAESVCHLFDLGFTDVAANFIFEETFGLDDGLIILSEILKVANYIFNNNLERKVSYFQLNHDKMDMGWNYRPASRSEEEMNQERNHCGSCKYMRCIGFDRKIYGCNRFLTMDKPNMEIGYLSENNEIIITKKKFIDRVCSICKTWADECKRCQLFETCPSCSAIPFETDDPENFFKKKNMCGFTYAQAIARIYYSKRFVNKHGKEVKGYTEEYENYLINKGELIDKNAHSNIIISDRDKLLLQDAEFFDVQLNTRFSVNDKNEFYLIIKENDEKIIKLIEDINKINDFINSTISINNSYMNNKYYFLGDEDARNNAIKENMNRINQSKENKAVLYKRIKNIKEGKNDEEFNNFNRNSRFTSLNDLFNSLNKI